MTPPSDTSSTDASATGAGSADPSTADGNIFGVGSSVSAFGVELGAVTPEQQAARDTAEAVRALIDRLAHTAASIEQLADAAQCIDAVTASLPLGAPGGEDSPMDLVSVRQAHRLRERSPFIGMANPLARPMEMAFGGDRIEARVTLDELHEGPPGCVHGGYVAAMFDEVLGAAQVLSGNAGMTGRLAVHYRSPTPLHVELRLRATLEKVEGRKILCHGTLHAGDRLCAEADGLFVTIDPERVKAMHGARAMGGATA